MKHSLFFLSLLFTNLNYCNHPRLLIKIPTRQRPAQFFNVLDLYYQQLSNNIPYIFLITCDIDDLSMNNAETKTRLSTYPNLVYYFNYNRTKIEAYNSDIKKNINDFDILLVASDDTKPSKNYDLILAQLMLDHFPDFDGIINFNDGHMKRDLNTLPVLGINYYKRFGYVYHPTYKALWCDNELTLISQILNKEYYCDQVIIEHLHPTWHTASYDDLYRRNDKFYYQDQAIFEQRKRKRFDLQ